MRSAIFLSNLILLCLLGMDRAEAAGEEWIFLKDGRVGWGNPAGDLVSVRLPGGTVEQLAKDKINFSRSKERIDKTVDAMLTLLSDGRTYTGCVERFKAMDIALVPKAIEFLKWPDARFRIAALFALQYGWSKEAQEAVLAALDDADRDVRKTAAALLEKHVPLEDLAKRLKPWVEGQDAVLAAAAFHVVGRYYPAEAVACAKRLLKDPKLRAEIAPELPRFLTPELTGDTLQLLDDPKPDVRRLGISSLVAQLADGAEVRARVADLLKGGRSEDREMAGEYFAFLGSDAEIPLLREALRVEDDAYARAALAGAVALLEARSKVAAGQKASREMLGVKDAPPADALSAFRTKETLEPPYVYGTSEFQCLDPFFVRTRQLFANRCMPGSFGEGGELDDFEDEAVLKPAGHWMPPVRGYADPKRKSFGFQIPESLHVFSGSVHIGDDVAWGQDLRTVVAVAPGVVRRVLHVPSWGFIVIVEHAQSATQRVCSLYAHLSPALQVRPGDFVECGQRIGAVGRGLTHENGGYPAHLHFGLHRGPYEQGRWITGYLSPETWQRGAHGWLAPQEFFAEHAAAPAASASR
ncbi:MAG: peptidoglycan DD-metalloendopeptidase family protein [Planctomycetes bacterium]|nr:peptidoglycan DD-metalloendopeptidase family protein [Planctomycetota bacterium]